MAQLLGLGDTDQFAQERGKLFLLRFIQGGEKLGDAFLEKWDRAFIEFVSLICQHDADYPPVTRVSFTGNQSLFLQPVYDAGQVAYSDHHLFTNLTERKPPSVADGRQNIELGWGEMQPLQIIL